METGLEKQRAAIERQRASVRAQVQAAQPADGFFTAPWTRGLGGVGQPCEPVPEDQIAPLVDEIAAREGLTPELLRAVIEKESAYLPCAVSTKGAQGLMQLMPDTAAGLGVRDPFDVRENLGGGARFLRQLLDKYGGNLVLSLAAYNAGPGRVDSAGGVPALPETLSYLAGILGKLPAGR